MRKVALFCAALLAGALGLTAIASAIQGSQTVSVSLRSNRAGTKAKPRSVSRVTVVTQTAPVQGEAPFAATRAVIHFDKNLVFNASKFPSCRQTVVQQNDAQCPRGSKVGRGSASATLFSGNAPSGDQAPRVTAYNGGSGKIYLLVVNPSPALRAVMVGTLKTDTGKYGRKLDVAIPPVLQNGGLPGLTITLTRFQTSVGGTFHHRPYVALRGCSGGKLSYKGDFTFRDNTGVVSTKSATSTGTCHSR
jgi:hypothetical protein